LKDEKVKERQEKKIKKEQKGAPALPRTKATRGLLDPKMNT